VTKKKKKKRAPLGKEKKIVVLEEEGEIGGVHRWLTLSRKLNKNAGKGLRGEITRMGGRHQRKKALSRGGLGGCWGGGGKRRLLPLGRRRNLAETAREKDRSNKGGQEPKGKPRSAEGRGIWGVAVGALKEPERLRDEKRSSCYEPRDKSPRVRKERKYPAG